MKSRSEVIKLVQVKIRLRHFAYSTEQAYCHWTGRYYDFCLTLPSAWSPERKTGRGARQSVERPDHDPCGE